MTSPGRDFYERHIALLEANDVENLIKRQYADDAILVGFGVEQRGHAQLLPYFKDYLAHLGGLKVESTDKFAETEDSIFFEATVRTAHGIAKVYDVFILDADQRATRQYTGLLSFTPFAPQS